MPRFVEMDDLVTLAGQMEDTAAPLVPINRFQVKADQVGQLLKAWTADAAAMWRQPDDSSTRPHRGLGGGCVFVNHAVWESTEHCRRLIDNPDFQSQLGLTRPARSPHRRGFARSRCRAAVGGERRVSRRGRRRETP